MKTISLGIIAIVNMAAVALLVVACINFQRRNSILEYQLREFGQHREKSKTFNYFVSWATPIQNGINREGHTVIACQKPMRTMDDIQAAIDAIRPALSNFDGNLIVKAFTPLP